MSEVKSRPSGPRGRGSGRGGRGGHSNRSGRGGSRSQVNGTSRPDDSAGAFAGEDGGEIGELKHRFSSELGTIKEMFPDWTDEDIIFALQESDGDLEGTIEKISEGNVSQWGEVKKKTRDRSQVKTKEAAGPFTNADQGSAATRGRGSRRGPDTATRASTKSRAADRGRASARGARGGSRAPAGTEQAKSNGTVDALPSLDASGTSGAWADATADLDSSQTTSSWENVTADQVPNAGATDQSKPASKPDGSRSWASMFAKPKPAPVSKHVPPSASKTDGLPPPAVEASDTLETPPPSGPSIGDPSAIITPPRDDLTETNLEKVPDNSGPAATATAASTAASTIDQRVTSGTPLQPGSQRPSARPSYSGFATSAFKATGMPGRTSSYQKKILEQQEAVVMPSKQSVDKAAVQFGSMGLNGTPDEGDVDSDREDAETRAQPPQHSPIAPRASLPPATQGPPQQPGEPHTAPRQAPGLPPVSQASSAPQQPATESHSQLHSGYGYNQFNDRYGAQDSSLAQKPYETFGQQTQSTHQHDPFQTNTNAGPGGDSRGYFSDKYGAMNSQYGQDDRRGSYQANHYAGYGQQQQVGHEPQQRTGSAVGSSAPSQQSLQATAPSRFGQTQESSNSGQSTPYGSISNTNQPHMSQQSQGPGQHSGYNYGGYPYSGYYSSYMNSQHYGRERPMYDDARRFDEQYMGQNPQYGYGAAGQGGYGGGPFGASNKGMYGQHGGLPGYGMSPQASSHDQQSSSPANAGAFGQQAPSGSGRDSAAGGLGGYGTGRSGSTQPSEGIDVFSRSQQYAQGSQAEDPLRSYGGPSGSSGVAKGVESGQQSGAGAGRPSSTANPQSTLPPQDARYGAQGGYGGYHHSQYGQHNQSGGGHAGQGQGHHGHQGAYGAYGAGYGGYYGGSNRAGGAGAGTGGWGGSYGH